MSALEKTYITPEQYLERERKADSKSEYYAGEIFAMSGGSSPHSLIGLNIAALLWNCLRGKACTTFNSDMRVHVEGTSLFTYPDVTVVCGPVQFVDIHRDNVVNPRVIFEVLSPFTEAYDRGEKFALYRNITSLTDYLLVSQEMMRVENYTWQRNNQWTLAEFNGPEAVVKLANLNCELRLADVYERVEASPERNVPRIRRLQT